MIHNYRGLLWVVAIVVMVLGSALLAHSLATSDIFEMLASLVSIGLAGFIGIVLEGAIP